MKPYTYEIKTEEITNNYFFEENSLSVKKKFKNTSETYKKIFE